MPSLFKPSTAALECIRAAESRLDFTYPEVGATSTFLTPPSAFRLPHLYAVDHTRVDLGAGAEVFSRATTALRQWQQFDLGWLEVFPTDTEIAVGQTVLVIARAGGLWWTNAARIVYVVDEVIDTIRRFGFAYGTLPGHVEAGEERFLIEWDPATNRVHFDIAAFSRPSHPLVRLNRRRARAMQKHFAKEATAALRQQVAGP